MVSPNWGLLQMNGPMGGFQNALAQGWQMGTAVRQQREEGERRNALSGYLTNPSDEAFATLAQVSPDTAVPIMQQRQQQQQQARQSGFEGVQQFRPLLEQAMQGPEEWARVRAAAAAGGQDVSMVPEQYMPEWAQGQLMILNAAERGVDLTTTANDVLLSLPPEQRDINSPAFITAMGRALERQIPVEPGGRVVGVSPVTGQARDIVSPGYGPQGGQQAPPPQAGQARSISAMDFTRILNGFDGDASRAASYTQENNVAVQVNSPQEASMLPQGTLYVTPDGQEYVR